MSDKPNRKEPGIEPINKTYEELNERQQIFVDSVATGYHKESRFNKSAGERMTLGEAYEMAGYAGKAKKQNGWRLYMQLKAVIYKRRSDLVELNMAAVQAAEIVHDLMRDKDVPPAVRLKAAQDMLSRSGFDQPQEISLIKKVDDMQEQEIDDELEAILSGAKKPDDEREKTRH